MTYGFENFQLAEPNCASPPEHFSIWVMYGGKALSGAIYCCPGEGGEDTRSKPLTIDGTEVPLVEDSTYHALRELLGKEEDTTVRVTVVGTFLSGLKQTIGGTTRWGGYGHLGCCSLFVIQKVEKFEPHIRDDLDYTAEAGFYEEEGCDWDGMSHLRHVSITYEGADEAISEQALADSGERAWAFVDPLRVALESLKLFYDKEAPRLRNVKNTKTRQVFRWKKGKKIMVVVVVIRPYWLSYYSKSGSVAWVATTIKEAECR
jgi:hypothetical protein